MDADSPSENPNDPESAVFILDLENELKTLGSQGFLEKHSNAVLVALGQAETVQSQGVVQRDGQVQRPSQMFSLISLVGRVFPLRARTPEKTSITIGRSEENDIGIPESSISKQHCAISFDGPTVTITDLGSRNGTVVDG